jgi:threonine synthase
LILFHDWALVALRNGGTAEAVSDEEILKAQRLLASTEGIFAEPSGVASLAGLIRVLDEGVVGKDETVVVLITGSGLKNPEAVKKTFKEASTVKPSTEELEKLWP